MTSLDRPLAGDAITFDLDAEIDNVRNARAAPGSGRTARTLVKDGPLRVTLILIDGGAAIAEHHADGPITIQVLRGSIDVDVAGATRRLSAGQLLAAGAGVRHAIRADRESVFLLTVVQPGGGH